MHGPAPRLAASLATLLGVAALGACARPGSTAEARAKTDNNPENSDRIAEMKLESPAFAQQEPIPREYTCEGEDRSPPLRWSGVPEGAKSLALIVDDPDAPDPKAPKRTWIHWVVFGIPTDADAIPSGGPLPSGAQEGRNDWDRTDYGGPCPPIGEHRYFFKLYALDTQLGELSQPSKAELERAMQGHILAQTELVGRYEKSG